MALTTSPLADSAVAVPGASPGAPGVRVASTAAASVPEAADALAAALGADPRLVLVFSGTHLDVGALTGALARRFPGARVMGCSTAGEWSATGHSRGTASALALGGEARVATELVELDDFHFDTGRHVLARLAAEIGQTIGSLQRERHVLVMLTDGLTGGGELLAASLGTHAPHIAMVGGAAGDDGAYRRTIVAADGRSSGHGAVVALLDPGVPFHPFATHHFRATERRVVVTAAEPQRRIVHELDGWPAARTLAQLLGVPRAELAEALRGRSASFGFAHAGDWYMRAVMTLDGDSLLMGGAVAVGTVLRWMEPGDLVRETTAALAGVARALPTPPAGLLLFHCLGRSRAATAKGLQVPLAAAMCGALPIAGFETYGEHLGPFLVNETLTGLAFGAPARATAR